MSNTEVPSYEFCKIRKKVTKVDLVVKGII